MSNLRQHASALFSNAAVALIRNQSGDILSVTNTVPGIYVVTLGADQGLRRQDGIAVMSVNENPNPPRQCVANIVHTSATVKTVSVTEEDGASGIGVLTNLEWSLELKAFSDPGT